MIKDTQKVTSANISQKQIAGFYKKALKNGMIDDCFEVFDYGCGKHLNLLTRFAMENKFMVYGFDKYNQTEDHNNKMLDNVKYSNFIACNNVLNVLENVALYDVMAHLHGLSLKHNKKVYITVYEGDKSGIGKVSKKDCYQQNRKALDYVKILKKLWKKVYLYKGIITCENPKEV